MILRSRICSPLFRNSAQCFKHRYSTHPPARSIDSKTLAELQAKERELAARQPKSVPQGSDRALYLTAIGMVLVTPLVCWGWWQHRAEHMGKKKEDLKKQMEIKRQQWIEENKT